MPSRTLFITRIKLSEFKKELKTLRMGKVTPWLAAVAPEKENRFRNKRKGNLQKKPKVKKWEKEDQIIQEKVARYNETFEADVPFAGYPLSPQTQRGLRRYLPEECTPTRIQQETIMLALQGNGKSESFLLKITKNISEF